MPKILEGIRVIECAWWLQGPAAGQLLGDMGAEVIKVEEPVRGDPMRGVERYMGVSVDLPNGHNFQYELVDRSKKSVTLDLKNPKGKEVFYKLVQKSDVFLTNLRGGTLQSMGLDYQAIRQHNPKIIYAKASGFGKKGPDADLRSFDNVSLARSGFMYIIGERDTPPQPMVWGMCDMLGATMCAFGVVSALLARERLGIGQEVDASLLGGMIYTLGIPVGSALALGRELPRPKRTDLYNPLMGWYQCGDGKWIVFSHQQPQVFWKRFCQALGLVHLENDPRFANTRARGENNRELTSTIDKVLAAKPRDEWLVVFRKHDLIFGPVQTVTELTEDPQAIANNYISEYDHPTLGKQRVIGFPIDFSQTPAGIQSAAPELGEHTEQVLNEILGYSWEEIGMLRGEGIV